MGVPTLEVGYTSATTGKGDHEVHKEHVVAKNMLYMLKLWDYMEFVTQISTCY
jgi:hypothetical protein